MLRMIVQVLVIIQEVFAGGGQTPSSYQNTMDYITIASTGNATDFGDLTAS